MPPTGLNSSATAPLGGYEREVDTPPLPDILHGMGKVLISVPDDLLERIDHEARARGTTRSRYIEEAARRLLGWPAPEEVDAVVARAREALGSAGEFDSAALIRRTREDRDAADRRRL